MTNCRWCDKPCDKRKYCSRQCSSKYHKRTSVAKTGDLLHSAKRRALQKNLDFCLTKEDIKIPEKCPILGTKLFFHGKKMSENTPTIDRKDPSKGYTPDNIQIISYRANELKSNATKEEIRLLLEWMEKNAAE